MTLGVEVNASVHTGIGPNGVAVHVLTLLALSAEERRSSRYLAGSVATNPVVIRRLLAQLAQAGLVESAHGATGGFRLARPAAKARRASAAALSRRICTAGICLWRM